MPDTPVLEVSGLSVDYLLDRGAVRAVDDVSFTVSRGEFLGVVGESGCGKSTLLFAIAQLLAPPARSPPERHVRRHEPGGPDRRAALRDPLAGHVGRHAERDERAEPGQDHRSPVLGRDAGARQVDRAEIAARSAEVLRMVGIDPVHLGSYPHQLSGGMRQRSMIAMAHAVHPGPGHHGRAHLRARRGGAAVADGADQGAAADVRLRGHLRHPRHVADQSFLGPADGDVRRPGR